MKINKRNPWHWIWLGAMTINVALAVILRRFMATNNRVVLYGHKLNGNLAAIYRESLKHKELRLTYLTMDYPYYQKLKQQGIDAVWAGGPDALMLLVRAKILISDHGLHSLVLLLDYSSLKFVDVWHGIPFKGFDKDDFKVQQRYDDIWVTSNFMADLYEEKFGFKREKLKAIGYARTDVLVKPQKVSRAELMRKYDIPVTERKVILYAPTWKQDDSGRSLFPFGMVETEFLRELSRVAESGGCLFIVRMHLNASSERSDQFESVYAVPADKYPDTERLLLLSDILIYDWSSIAFDYLLLNRPAIYLDVVPPFKKGFSLGDRYRFGAKVSDLDGLVSGLLEIFDKGFEVNEDELLSRSKILDSIYSGIVVGSASKNNCQRLLEILKRSE